MKKRVVITGLGIISSIGIGVEHFWNSLLQGKSGIRPITLFDTSKLRSKHGGEITDFDPKSLLGPKGLQYFDRTTSLICSATKLALEDAKIEISDLNRSEIGVVVGTALGSMASIGDFERTAITEGVNAVLPMSFPNTVLNSFAGHVAIKFGIEGFNSTLSTGGNSALDAIIYGLDSIRMERSPVVLAGGGEGLCMETYWGAYLTGLLSGSNDGHDEICAPFDKRRNGIILGEGSAMLVLEDFEYAKRRGAKIYAEILNYGSTYDNNRSKRNNNGVEGAIRSMSQALEYSAISPQDINYICASANSTVDGDKVEALAVKRVFGEGNAKMYVSSIKSMTGECYSAMGAMQVCASALAVSDGMIPPTINFREKDPDCDLNLVVNESRRAEASAAMTNSFACTGNSSSLIITKWKDN